MFLIVAGLTWAIIGVGNIFVAHYLARGHSAGPWFNIVVFVVPGLVLVAVGELGRLAWWPRARAAPGGSEDEAATWQVIVYDPSRHRDVLRSVLRAHHPDLSDAEVESRLDTPRVVIASGLPAARAAALERELASANPTMRMGRARGDGTAPPPPPAVDAGDR